MKKLNLAVVIAISEYEKITPLSGCQNDFKLIYDLIGKTNKYDKILAINSDTNALSVKHKLKEFIEENKGMGVNELFFYYTGHGHYDGKELRYILTDFDQEKLNATTLTNEFVDNMLRSLNPELTIKVVDSCNSGIHYIKGDEILFQEKAFNNCYFMFSSHREQSSFIDKLSFFTKSFANAIVLHKSQIIGYSDIIDYIKDDFKSQENQTPFFCNTRFFN